MALFARAVDEACLKLGCDEAQKATVAARVLSFAAKGTHDYETLRNLNHVLGRTINSQRPVAELLMI
jgi:hypothetical protein